MTVNHYYGPSDNNICQKFRVGEFPLPAQSAEMDRLKGRLYLSGN